MFATCSFALLDRIYVCPGGIAFVVLALMIGGGGCLGGAERVADGMDIRSLSHSMFRWRQVANKNLS